ncbi:MAG: DinB family protein [Thiohalocapsa sp.]
MNHDDNWLAPPGAGIPRLERNLLGVGIRLAAQLVAKDRLTAVFRDEALRALDTARRLSEDAGRRRVLIPRFLGIEDSSRNWSVFMTLEHLVIVNTAIAAALPRLYAGHGTSTDVRVEDVKPVPEAGPEQIDDLALLVDRYTDMVEKLGNLRAGIAHPHPWFGLLSAAQWHALAAVHNSVHRRQIERIVKAF